MTTSINSNARSESMPASIKSPSQTKKANVSSNRALSGAEHRHVMIAEAAYLLAEQRHFEAGHDVEDWLAAESALNLV